MLWDPQAIRDGGPRRSRAGSSTRCARGRSPLYTIPLFLLALVGAVRPAAAGRRAGGGAARVPDARRDGLRRRDALPRAVGLPARARGGSGDLVGGRPEAARREGRARPPDPRDRRIRAASADAAAGAAPSTGSSRCSSGSTTRPGGSSRSTPSSGVESVRLPCPRDLDLGLARRVRRELARLRAGRSSTRTSCTATSTARSAPAARRSSRPSTTTTASGAAPFRFVERALTRRASRVIAITEALRRFCVDEVGLPAAKVEVVHYGLDALPRAVGRRARRCRCRTARACSSASRGSRSRRASTSRSARSRGCARSSRGAVLVVLGEGPERPQRSPARASTCRAASATSPPGTGARSCSSTPRAGRASGSRCSRRCSPGSRWSRSRVSSVPGARRRRRDRAARPAGRRGGARATRCSAARRPGARRGDGRGRPRAGAARVLGREDGRADGRGLRARVERRAVEDLRPVDAALLEEVAQRAAAAGRAHLRGALEVPRQPTIASRSGSASPGATSSPVSPSRTSSPRPPISAAITGRARSIASSATMPKPSPIDGTTTIAERSIALWIGAT